MLETKGLTLHYGGSQILYGVDMVARAGEVTCVMGTNGVGKTSLRLRFYKAWIGFLKNLKKSSAQMGPRFRYITLIYALCLLPHIPLTISTAGCNPFPPTSNPYGPTVLTFCGRPPPSPPPPGNGAARAQSLWPPRGATHSRCAAAAGPRMPAR